MNTFFLIFYNGHVLYHTNMGLTLKIINQWFHTKSSSQENLPENDKGADVTKSQRFCLQNRPMWTDFVQFYRYRALSHMNHQVEWEINRTIIVDGRVLTSRCLQMWTGVWYIISWTRHLGIHLIGIAWILSPIHWPLLKMHT